MPLGSTYEELNAHFYIQNLSIQRIVAQMNQTSTTQQVKSVKSVFLDSAKGSYDYESETELLLEVFGDSLGSKNQAAMDFTVNSSMETLLKSTGFVMNQCDTLKSAYSLYNTAHLLNQDNAASIELIEESVALFDSKIAA